MTAGVKTVTENRRARYEYFIEDVIEAGIALMGTEVKSIRQGRANLADAYASIEGGEVILYNMHISPYDPASQFNHDPLRPRKLLLHRQEIAKISGRVVERGYTLVPLKLYFRRGLAKVELAVAKGKRLYDKREAIAKRDREREIDRGMSERRRSY
ncbi:MAG: SsrA-binding protein SmpB [Bacillota bacterium]